MKRRLIVLGLFAALVAALLWFQGILFRHEPRTTRVPGAPELVAGSRTARAALRTVGSARTFPGFVEAIDAAPLAARVLATIVSLDVREGDPVQAGAIGGGLAAGGAGTSPAQAEAAHAEAAAHATLAKSAIERAEQLLAVDAVTTAEWESARAMDASARAAVDRAQAAVDEARTALSWFQVTAPFDGVVLARHSEAGQLASPGMPLVTLHRADRLRLAVPVPEERASGLSVGERLAVTFDGCPERMASLSRILPAVDAKSGTVLLHLVPDDVSDLRPGGLGRLELSAGERQALLVPGQAVVRVGQLEHVSRVVDGRVVLQSVRTGKRHGDDVEVLSGLGPGDEVVVP